MHLKVGAKISVTKVFDDTMVKAYAELTGDFNPIHFDYEFASTTIFKRPIVHGPLVLNFVTTLFATQLPGPGSVYLSHEVKYLSPVYYDDHITARLEIIDINDKNHIFIQTTCFNQKNVVVLDGIARLKIF